MALNNVNFNTGQGGLGRPLPGQDYISGLILYGSVLPSGFTASNRIKQIFAITDAVSAGIKSDNSDEIQSIGTLLITVAGSLNDTITALVTEASGKVVTLGSYIKTAGQITATDVATALELSINSRTIITGYSASISSATISIKARIGLGISLNQGTPLSVIYNTSATLAATITQFSGGVASLFAPWNYHISEYFRMQPQGNLYVGIFAAPSIDFIAEITAIQNYSNGTIRQVAIYSQANFAGGNVQAISDACKTMETAYMPLISVYAADISSVTDISTLADESLLTANLCTPCISQDGAALGSRLFTATGKTISNIGALLGTIARAKVSYSIAWVAQFNISNGIENDVPAFGNGVLLRSPSITSNLLAQLQDKCYIFLRKFVGQAGSYWNENRTAIVSSSDYAFIADNRTVQKAKRVLYTALVPALNSPVALNADGTLADESVAYFTTLSEAPLVQMIRDGELSGQSVIIDTMQNILLTGVLYVTVHLLEIATARNIIVNIGYVVKIT